MSVEPVHFYEPPAIPVKPEPSPTKLPENEPLKIPLPLLAKDEVCEIDELILCEVFILHEAVPNREPVIAEPEIIEAVIGPVNKLSPIIFEFVEEESINEPVIFTSPKRLIVVLPVHFDEPPAIPVN